MMLRCHKCISCPKPMVCKVTTYCTVSTYLSRYQIARYKCVEYVHSLTCLTVCYERQIASDRVEGGENHLPAVQASASASASAVWQYWLLDRVEELEPILAGHRLLFSVFFPGSWATCLHGDGVLSCLGLLAYLLLYQATGKLGQARQPGQGSLGQPGQSFFSRRSSFSGSQWLAARGCSPSLVRPR